MLDGAIANANEIWEKKQGEMAILVNETVEKLLFELILVPTK